MTYKPSKMSYCIYILVSEVKSDWSYVGQTDNLEERFSDHSRGKVKSTKGYRPLRIAHLEYFNTREEALVREAYLKTGAGREEKRRILLDLSAN
jgi:putative endonuclease